MKPPIPEQPALFAMPAPALVPVYLLWSDRYQRPAMHGFVCAQCAVRLMRERFPAEMRVRKVLERLAGVCWVCGGSEDD